MLEEIEMGSEGAKQFINLILAKNFKDFDLQFWMQLFKSKNSSAFPALLKLNSKLNQETNEMIKSTNTLYTLNEKL